ncbi:MAG: peptidylprolyl isomerase [Sphingobacterium sp.]|uniref:peptidylprolyl isomerase n=1 Tax=Sphingobacterium sp. JB170 TaxID=1434842 RepID=UPI00097E8626|nr:peptidylprolyl isomerase [Sphingobacterium sp. JB170]SJN44208.1 Peptidyl-prolyl cis-trans isomerase [Sphingobacterium sp. JB170]
MKELLKKILLFTFCLFISASALAKKPVYHYVHIETDKGNCLLKLYNATPKHRDNFVKLVREGFYEDLMFHRVIENFMVQGGDPDSKFAAQMQELGEGGPDYTLAAEIQDTLIHKKGAIGAARDNNPAKRSSASQFYLVQGHVFTQPALDSLEQFRLKGEKLTPLQRETYSTIGGTPHLDNNYTVFGELIEGLEIIDKIASMETDRRDRPVEDVRMKMKVLSRREALNLEREQAGLPAKNGAITKFFDLFSSPNY